MSRVGDTSRRGDGGGCRSLHKRELCHVGVTISVGSFFGRVSAEVSLSNFTGSDPVALLQDTCPRRTVALGTTPTLLTSPGDPGSVFRPKRTGSADLSVPALETNIGVRGLHD